MSEQKYNINETVLSVLRKNESTNQIEIDYVEIEQHFTKEITEFEKICNDDNTTLDFLINHINKTTIFNQLNAYYRYCRSLTGTYQAFQVRNLNTLIEIDNLKKHILAEKKLIPFYNPEEDIIKFKHHLKEKYIVWVKAYCIKKTYVICNNDKSIITFSHRIDGWSNPLYQLTPNFSLEIKTNFGYGNSSYFFTKLKFKDIDITPFSEWVNYEFAKFIEIIRYTKIHTKANEYWQEAMEFSRDACNLSIKNEDKFVEKYIIDECEEMIVGLEDIFNKDHFSFIDRDKNQYAVDKKGHLLVAFRGEKISGALDFITKILEYKKITSVQSFIDRIELVNKKIQPILVDESNIIKTKLSNLNKELKELKPIYDNVIKENIKYNIKRKELQKLMINKGQLDLELIDKELLNEYFLKTYPEYKDFLTEYRTVTESYKFLKDTIANLTTVLNKINSYNAKILSHFNT